MSFTQSKKIEAPGSEFPFLRKIKKLQVILKIAERCNLACTYCYYFFGGDNSYKDRPPLISLHNIHEIAKFLSKGATKLEIEVIEIIFHGGEPMLQKPRIFDEMCSILYNYFLNHPTQINLSIQTNGTLINEEWLNVFSKHLVSIGVSIDGPRHYNDKYRIDHKGKGTFELASAGISKIIQAEQSGQLQETLGTITVMNSDFNYHQIFNFLVTELRIRRLNFLLPDISYTSNSYARDSAESYGKIMSDIFDSWLKKPETNVRFIDETLSFFKISNHQKFEIKHEIKNKKISNQIIVIQSDGTLSLDDSLIPASKWRNTFKKKHVSEIELDTYLTHPFFEKIENSKHSIPDDCQACCWKKLCRGGDLENRYSEEREFNNKSIYCGALMTYFEHVVSYLVKNGYPIEEIEKKLT